MQIPDDTTEDPSGGRAQPRRLQRIRRVQVWGSWCLLCFFSAMLLTVHIRGQVDLERRLQEQEAVHADRRLSVIETRLDSIEFLGRGILLTVAGQLVLNGLAFRRRLNADEEPRVLER